MKQRITTAVIGLLMGLAGSVFANSINLNGMVGAAFSQLSNTQSISPVTGLINSYASSESVQSRPFYGLGAEYTFDPIIARPITFSLGLSVYYLAAATIRGTETPGVNILLPPQDTLSYTMQVKSLTLLFEPKLTYSAFRVQPYVLGGLGSAWNTLNHFSEGTVPGSLAAPSTSPYPGHTQTKFAYELGAGLQTLFKTFKNNQVLLVHVEYRYFNLGQSRLGSASAQTTQEHLTVNNTANSVDFGLTYRL